MIFLYKIISVHIIFSFYLANKNLLRQYVTHSVFIYLSNCFKTDSDNYILWKCHDGKQQFQKTVDAVNRTCVSGVHGDDKTESRISTSRINLVEYMFNNFSARCNCGDASVACVNSSCRSRIVPCFRLTVSLANCKVTEKSLREVLAESSRKTRVARLMQQESIESMKSKEFLSSKLVHIF